MSQDRSRRVKAAGKGEEADSVPEDLWSTEEELNEGALTQDPTGSGLWRVDEGAPPTSSDSDRLDPAPIWRDHEGVTAPSLESFFREPPGSRTTPQSSVTKRLLVLGMGILFLAGVADLTYAGLGVRNNLRSAGLNLRSAQDALANGELSEARGFLAKAENAVSAASTRASRPSLAGLSYVPVVGNDAETVQRLTRSARLMAGVGSSAVNAAEAVGIDEEGIASSLYEDGSLNFEAIEQARPYLDSMSADLTAASAILREAPRPLLPAVSKGLRQARDEVANGISTSRKASLLLSLLPDLFGDAEPRTYLLAMQALGEARATGGVIGTYGVLVANGGELRLREVGPYTDLFPAGNPIPPVPAPLWFREAYEDQLGLRQWSQANLSPNFPAVAEVLLGMYEARTGEQLDGVMAMDPVAMSLLMRGTDPLTIDGYKAGLISSENLVDVLLHDAYLEYPNRDSQDDFLTALVNEFWTTVEDGNVNGSRFVAGISTAVSQQHLKIYRDEERPQAVLHRLGASNDYTRFAPNVQMIFNNNYSRNKVDYFLRRHISTVVRLVDGGDAIVKTRVRLENDAPSGPPSVLLGRAGEQKTPGRNKMTFNTLLPPEAEVSRFTINGAPTTPLTFEDDNHPVVWQVVDLAPGESTTLAVTYVLRQAAEVSNSSLEFTFTMFPQTTTQPDSFRFSLVPPPGYDITEIEPGVTEAGLGRASGELDGVVTLRATARASD